MASEPDTKRTIAFFDGQNLYHAAKQAFGTTYPDYDPRRLAEMVCQRRSWTLVRTQFYTGIPTLQEDAFWHGFWNNKIRAMKQQGLRVFKRDLRYASATVRLADGSTEIRRVGREKGIDVRISIDVFAALLHQECDVALIFSQDQDLSEVAKEARRIAREQQRWICMASAFPVGPASVNRRGINSTDWIRIDKTNYAACVDPNDYRPTPSR